MTNDKTNRPQLDEIRKMPVGEIVKLPAEHLALLQDDATAALEAAKRLKDWLEGAIALRYAERASGLRRAESKDTGTIRFNDENVCIVADLPKKVDWDQALIADVVARIRAAGDDPSEYVDISFKVPERKFTAWPEAIRAAFAPARTVQTGKPTFRLILISEAR